MTNTAPKFSRAALENIYATGVDWGAALDALEAGVYTRESLLELCLDGADEEYVDGWHDYVDALLDEVERRRAVVA